MPRKSVQTWFADYGASHQNRTNELLHWICVPLIVFSVLGFVWEIPVSPVWETSLPWFNWSIVAIALITLFYAWLSVPLAVGMLGFMTLCQTVHLRLEMNAPWAVWKICLGVFVLAWIGQIVGHHLEKKKPSFLKDLLFLLIGPAWLLGKIYQKVGLPY